MTISDSLQQIYFLGAHPEKQGEVAAHLLRANAAEPQPHTGRWHLFARLARPGLIAMRSVSRTTGLDLFLLDSEMEGVEDVAEIIGYGLENTTAGKAAGQQSAEDAFPSGWREFDRCNSAGEPACLFLTFVRLNWDALMDKNVWSQCGIRAPSRTQILRAVAATLRRAAGHHSAPDPLEHFHMAGGTGDCDLIITGLVGHRSSLDRFLLVLAQIGTDCVAAELGLPTPQVVALATWYPICASSTTELGVPWDIYADVQAVTRQAVESQSSCTTQDICSHPFTQAERVVGQRVDALLHGGLRSAVFLRRTHSFLTNVRRSVEAIAPPEWTLQAVLGEADMLLRRAEERTAVEAAAEESASAGSTTIPKADALSNLLLLLGRLDAKNAVEKDFPRRIAVVITFDRLPYLSPFPRRHDLLPVTAEAAASSCPAQQQPSAEDLSALRTCQELLTKMLHSRRREEYRILERMVERAVTLQRQHDLSRELRSLARLALRRLARALIRLAKEEDSAQNNPEIDLEADDQDARGNESFIRSGMHLDRTLQHHARGTVPLLLATATQARSADHFGSETTLTSALGAPASSVARRLLADLARRIPAEAQGDPVWSILEEALKDMKAPILYASHDPNFELIAPLCMIRVPRWVIWYPTVSSYVLHEVGHEVFHCGRLRPQADRLAWTAIHLLLNRCEGTGSHDEAAAPDEAQAKEWQQKLALLRKHLLGEGEPDPVVRLGGAASPPAAIQWIEQLLWERIDVLDQGQSFAAQDWYGQLDEVAAQVFCHRYSYWPEDGSEVGSIRHIYDVLEHIAPLTHRMQRPHRLLFITRELAVRIALRLIETAEQGISPWHMSEARLTACVVPQMDIFRKCLAEWLATPPVPFQEGLQNRRLFQDVLDIYHQLLDFPIKGSADEFQANYQTPIGKAVNWGIFLALMATSQDVMPDEPASVAITQHLWKAILKTSRDADTAPPDLRAREDAIVDSLTRGVVPEHVSNWPERLPRRLHDILRRQNSSVYLPQRFALTLTLADWMVVNDASEEVP